MLWHEQSWPKIGQLNKHTPVVIPLGSCEQHGHHMPLFVDTIQVTEVAKRVEVNLADQILLMPTFWLGSSHHHKDFPGTISVVPSLYSQIIKSITRRVLEAGFDRVLFLNGHGGNEVPGAQALTELVAEYDDADAASLAFASWWRLARTGIAPEKHGMTTPFVSHACEYETSMMLFLRSDLVDMGRVRLAPPVMDNQWFHSEGTGSSKVSIYHRFARLTAPGNMGRADQATAPKGESLINAVVEQITVFLTDFATWPQLPAVGPE